MDVTKEQEDKLLAAVRVGSFVAVACQQAGIGDRGLAEWLEGGNGQDPRYTAFQGLFSAVRHAEADAEVMLLADVRRKAEGWQASLALLKQRFPLRWNRIR